ncbi:hypothetical protein RFI_12427 [Reticulomyxa filosa]|uniref:Spindle pole body component n=1 Tax=Reticulomyxa filosa TaxID=46433 RepID=X6NG31_RETFI|nr:hypothetical protein RFI_12427 [Reticulomyxa filosa]|eukprot:ETO24729.1 hypothetical protein RFI_12427 [Reticulomyxa filosa]
MYIHVYAYVCAYGGKDHNVYIGYDFITEEFQVRCDNKLALFLNEFDISKYLTCEMNTGRGYVGFTSALHPNKSNNDQGNTKIWIERKDNIEELVSTVADMKSDISVIIDISEWTFEGKSEVEMLFKNKCTRQLIEKYKKTNTRKSYSTWKHFMEFWSRFHLKYAIDNPLDVIFHRNDLERYNALFRHLLLLRRCHYLIKECWKSNRCSSHLWSSPHSTVSKDRINDLCRFVNICINKMLFFVNVLMFYANNEIIECHYHHLIDQIINHSNTIDQVMQLHDVFLHNLCKHFFIIANHTTYVYTFYLLSLVLEFSHIIDLFIQWDHTAREFDWFDFENELRTNQKVSFVFFYRKTRLFIYF